MEIQENDPVPLPELCSGAEKCLIGLKQGLKAVRGGEAQKVWLASDAQPEIAQTVITECRINGIAEIDRSLTMSQLGSAAHIEVCAAVAVVIKNTSEQEV